jgi:hypothetical protein
VYLDRTTARQRYPEEWLAPFKEEGGLAVTVEVGDLEVAARATGGVLSDTGAYLTVPPDRASGVVVTFAA